MRRLPLHVLGFALAAYLVIGCGGGGGGGGGAPPPPPPATPTTPEAEPNDGPGTGTPIPSGSAGTGAIGVGDLDYWSFTATAGDVIMVEFFGARHNQVAWDTNVNSATIRILTWDGVTETPLLTHTFAAWNFSRQDQDIPSFRIATTGTHYLRVAANNAAAAGGNYAFRIVTLPAAALQSETEANETPATANAITPGTVHATHGSAADLDF